MQTSADAVYLDSSALVKLVAQERESRALASFLTSRPHQISCALATVEVIRAIKAFHPALVVRARQVLREIDLLRLDDALLTSAADIEPLVLRSLDAIHLAAAQTIADDIRELVTYDQRLARAATHLGFAVVAPGR